MNSSQIKDKESTIFHHLGNSIKITDREIPIIARFEEPLVVVLGNVLSDEECDELICLSKDKVQRSKVGATREINEIRTSSGAFLDEDKHPLIATIEKRISTIMNIPIEHGEGLHILKYTPGQEYKDHFDYVFPFLYHHKYNYAFLNLNNNRLFYKNFLKYFEYYFE